MKNILRLIKIIEVRMAKSSSETRFEEARKKLANAFRDLEEEIKTKLHETIVQARMLNASKDSDSSNSLILEHESTIQILTSEINKLQESLSDLGKESEFLREKNKALNNKIENNRKSNLALIETIELDLTRIEALINQEEK